MEVPFKYGEDGILLHIPEDVKADVKYAPLEEPLQNPVMEIYNACITPHLSASLVEILKNFQTKYSRSEDYICIVISDSTRPVPSKLILEALIMCLQEAQVPDARIKILVATGLHRNSTPQELEQMLGEKILAKFEIINHDATEQNNMEYLGENSFGSPIYLNKIYLQAKIKIITGYVEPHFFAGFSGGRKAVVPGIAGTATIQSNHSAQKIASPHARFGQLQGNPIFEDAQEIFKVNGMADFMINVCLDPLHRITKVAAGSYQVHDLLVQYQNEVCFFPITERYDVVVCGNGGYPLDLNLYQAVKSMAIGELGVKKGGTIIAINECRQLIGQPVFEELINGGLRSEEVTSQVLSHQIQCSDQWEIQVLARVLQYADVVNISSIPEHKLGTIGLKYAESFEDALEFVFQKHGRDFTMLVLPDGPQYLPKMHP